MGFKHTTHDDFSWLVDEESEEQSGERACQFIEICHRNTWVMGLILEVSFRYYSLSGIFPEAPSTFSEGRAIPPASVVSCHFIYPSAQHLSRDIVTGGSFLFPIRLWDPSWQTLCHLSMHPLGLEQHLACSRCQTRVCSGNDCIHAVWLAAIFILVPQVLFPMGPVV